jgi:hypothetical protein
VRRWHGGEIPAPLRGRVALISMLLWLTPPANFVPALRTYGVMRTPVGQTDERLALIAQLDVPVGEINKVSPTFVLLARKSDVDERPPLWPLRFPNQCHVSLMRKAIALSRIARNTGADDVFPRGQAAFVARQDVIEVQLLTLENLAAILAGVVVTLEDVVAGKLYFLFRQSIEEEKNNHAWHPDPPRNRRDHLVLGLRGGERNIQPAREIMRREIVFVIGRDHLGVTLVKQRKSTTRRANIDRLPKAIEHQNLTV